MTDSGSSTKVVLPYGAWPQLKSFIERLKQSAIPPRIDSSVMVGMSGSGKSELKAALRFLGLVDNSDVVLPTLRRIVDAHGTDQWRGDLTDLVLAAYRGVIGDDAAWLDNGTPQQLRERFRAIGGDVSTTDRAIRFFLAATADAGLKLSPHFSVKGARTAGTRPAGSKRRTPKPTPGTGKPAKNQGEPGRIADLKAPADGELLPFHIPGRGQVTVALPKGLTAAEWKMVNAFVEGALALQKSK